MKYICEQISSSFKLKMELKGQRYTIDASILLALVAVILCSRGLFSNEWWRDEQGFHHDIFTVVNCHGNVCVLGNSGSDTWIVFVQVMGLLQMTMLIAAVVNNIMVVVYANRLMSVVGLISLAIACKFSCISCFATKCHLTEVRCEKCQRLEVKNVCV